MNILLFTSIRDVMRADKLCREAGFAVKVMPVPHTYSTECGMSLVVESEYISDVSSLLEKNNILFTNIKN